MSRYTAFNSYRGKQAYFDDLQEAYKWGCSVISGHPETTLNDVKKEVEKNGKAMILCGHDDIELEDVVIADLLKVSCDENGYIEW